MSTKERRIDNGQRTKRTGPVCLAALAPGLPRGPLPTRRRCLVGCPVSEGCYVGRPTGETAMIVLGPLKAEVPPTDPAVQACIAKLRTRFTSSSYEPELSAGTGTYEAGATAMVFANLDASSSRLTSKRQGVSTSWRPNYWNGSLRESVAHCGTRPRSSRDSRSSVCLPAIRRLGQTDVCSRRG